MTEEELLGYRVECQLFNVVSVACQTLRYKKVHAVVLMDRAVVGL
jgi:hypothetical protein